MPDVSRTRATLRRAEFGFLGVVVYTRVHTPRRCGLPFRAGALVLETLSWRPLRTSCWIVGTGRLSYSSFFPCPLRIRPTRSGVSHLSERTRTPSRRRWIPVLVIPTSGPAHLFEG